MKRYASGDRGPLTVQIIACCYSIHNEIGAGFTERIYLNALKIALNEASLKYQAEKEFSL
jgi:GxxExxY protein